MALHEDGSLTIERVVFSVSEKIGIDDLARVLREVNPEVEFFGTAGSQKFLAENGIPGVGSITELTGNAKPDYFDHRMATISFNLESALLADREKPKHMQQLEELDIGPIDLVVCNLYPFNAAISANPTMETAIENIDIGGPCMIRAAAKNWKGVAVLVDPMQYAVFSEALQRTGKVSSHYRRLLAQQAFQVTSEYDHHIYYFFCDWNQ